MTRLSQINAVLDLLEKERAIIMSGNMTGLAEVVERREGLVRELRVPRDKATQEVNAALLRVADGARRNARLMEAAIEGVKAAETRIREIEEAHSTLGTYEPDGQKSSGPIGKSSVVKRA